MTTTNGSGAAGEPNEGGGLSSLTLRNIGPAVDVTIPIAPRLSLFLGDNGAGKTFALDVLFWAMTGHWWKRLAAWPRDGAPFAEIGVTARSPERSATATYEKAKLAWKTPPQWPRLDALVFYATVDGAYAIWDPALAEQGSEFALQSISAADLWNKPDEKDNRPTFLISTWNDCKANRQNVLDACAALLEELSPEGESIKLLGRTSRPWRDPPIDCPMIEMSTGAIPIVHAPAGVRRILGLTFLLAWAWDRHRVESSRIGSKARRLVLLVDEVEGHLHPKWQRLLLPALFRALGLLERAPEVQVVASTHSELIPASMEMHVDASADRLLRFDLHAGTVGVADVPWIRRGDSSGWLSGVFGLELPYGSREAEEAIHAAFAFERGQPIAGYEERDAITRRLRQVLPGQDPFLLEWLFAESRGER